jgi:hypothetical protein
MGWRIVALGVGIALLGSTAALAAPLDQVQGHLAVGYGKLFEEDAPGGSLALGAGIDLPATAALRTGVEVGYMLLGTRTTQEGSLVAELDYSLFEALALLHWTPPWRGPLGRISVGPGVFNARADLTASGGASFEGLARAETRPGAALALTLIQRRPAPVRIGLEVGARMVWLERGTWPLATTRLVVHY